MQSLLSKTTLFTSITILAVFFSLGFALFGPYTVGYSVGYFAAGFFSTLQAALPHLMLLAILWVSFLHSINRK